MPRADRHSCDGRQRERIPFSGLTPTHKADKVFEAVSIELSRGLVGADLVGQALGEKEIIGADRLFRCADRRPT